MKRANLLLVFLLMAVLPLSAKHVDPGTARKAAITFFNNNGVKATQLTDLSKEAGFPNLYIFNANPGFVVMAADDCTTPVLGYSLTGGFEVKDMPENLKWWLQGYNDQIQDVKNKNYPYDSNARDEWQSLITGNGTKSITEVVVGPLLSTAWKQQEPFNDLCPENTVTGCVATAMAQVMKKWDYPKTGIGSHSYYWNGDTYFADFGNTEYAWEDMLDDYSDPYSYTPEEANAVATLMYHCGVAVEMKYLAYQESGSTVQRAGCALTSYFNYSSTFIRKADFTNAAWISRITDDLDHGMPVLYGGSYEEQDGGHAFVCDGYNSENYLHFNWGWGPGSEGYYTVETGGHSFTRGQNAVVNIKPIGCLAGKPSNLAGNNPNGHQVTLSWDAGSNAVSYQIYRNNTLIANSTATSYIDDNPTIGANYYYIRSLDSEGNLSMPSSTISVNVTFSVPSVNHLKAQYAENQAVVSWPTPWWHPQNNVGILAYTDEERYEKDSYVLWEYDNIHLYWGIRHLATDLTSLQGKALFKTTFYVFYPGNYKVLVYQGTHTEEGDDLPANLAAEKSINTAAIGWVEAAFDDPIFIDDQDLWVFVYDLDGKSPWIPSHDNNNCNGLGQYYAGDYGDDYPLLPHEACFQLPIDSYKLDWFIRSYLTDGTYTYNLYDGDTKVNGNVPITSTSYTINNLADGVHQFTVKTNYSGSEAGASNMAGLTLGAAPALETLKLDPNDAMILTSGSTLTVTGTLINDDPARLIIEDGAQLFHNSAGVKATVKENITPYANASDKDGWNFIASPVSEDVIPSSNNGLLNGVYDLYYYDEPSSYWKNHKVAEFDIVPKQGYLYATNATNNTLQFAGTLTPSNLPVNSNTLSWSADQLKGFNLVGNPFPCNANLNSDFYVIDDVTHKVVLAATGRTIAPCEGVFVQADGENQTVTFSKAVESKDNESLLDLTVANDKMILDRIRVRMGDGIGMEKFSLSNQERTSLSLRCDEQDYAVAYSANQTSLPINFKAAHNGTYSLSVENNHLDLDYLHLVDNLTGMDIDLLATPSYSFDARTDDYASRFKLVFNPKTDNDVFGNDFVDGKTLIIDMTGRVVATDRNAQLVPGIYILRTTNGNETQSKKIIIQ